MRCCMQFTLKKIPESLIPLPIDLVVENNRGINKYFLIFVCLLQYIILNLDMLRCSVYREIADVEKIHFGYLAKRNIQHLAKLAIVM